MTDTNVVQKPDYQPQFQQFHQQYPRQQAPRTQFDMIPMKYAELLPMLLEKNLIHTKVHPRMLARLPTWYKINISCAFHQGAPGHDVKRCFALKKIVHKLIRDNILPPSKIELEHAS